MTLPLRGSVSLAPYQGTPLLKRAIGVQQFSQVMRISDSTGVGIADFQEYIRQRFPEAIFETETIFQFDIENDKITHTEQELPVWRFFDRDRKWRASLTRESISIETMGGYVNRYHFIDEMKFLVAAVGQYFAPDHISRSGARFVNAKEANGDEALKGCAPQLVSITGLDSIEEAALSWRFNVDEGSLLLRSGIVPAGTSHDPIILQPVKERSWVLDIDVFSTLKMDFEVDRIIKLFAEQVQRAHAVFRWAIPDGLEE